MGLLAGGCRETEPDWEMEIAADTKEEAAKFGPVSHLHVDRNSKACVPTPLLTLRWKAL